jgi:hypothetical protein
MPELPERIRDSFTPQELMARVEALRRLHDRGAMSAAQFNDFLAAFRFNDEIGHLWMPGANSGKWYRWDRTGWTQSEPPQALMLVNEGMQHSAEWMVTAGAATAGHPSTQKTGATAAADILCPSCGVRVKTGQKFCTACGKPISAAKAALLLPPPPPPQPVCPKCSKPVTPGKKFCAACGAALAGRGQ